jgi:putative redox protein
MSVRIEVSYDLDLQCSALHTPSGDKLVTDAPVDNAGRGLHFSPTDLVAAAVGACMLTVMGIVAQRRSLSMSGAKAVVDKEMSTGIRRFIQRLVVRITLPASLGPEARTLLEKTARTCPVAATLGVDTQIDLAFSYA